MVLKIRRSSQASDRFGAVVFDGNVFKRYQRKPVGVENIKANVDVIRATDAGRNDGKQYFAWVVDVHVVQTVKSLQLMIVEVGADVNGVACTPSSFLTVCTKLRCSPGPEVQHARERLSFLLMHSISNLPFFAMILSASSFWSQQ